MTPPPRETRESVYLSHYQEGGYSFESTHKLPDQTGSATCRKVGTQSANGSSQSSRGWPLGKGSVEGSHADRAQGLYSLDRLSQTTGDTETPDRESLRDAGGREATPLMFFNRWFGG